jgi:hypothetical protein
MRPGRCLEAAVSATRSGAGIVGRRGGEIPVVKGLRLILKSQRIAKRCAGSASGQGAGKGAGKMKSMVVAPLLAVALVCIPALGAVAADRPTPAAGPYSPVPPDVEVAQFTYAWQTLPLLPRRFQNHCGFFRGHFYCADHCGADYQLYYCSPVAFGCCHVGHGYCGGEGSLRCTTSLFPFD